MIEVSEALKRLTGTVTRVIYAGHDVRTFSVSAAADIEAIMAAVGRQDFAVYAEKARYGEVVRGAGLRDLRELLAVAATEIEAAEEA